MSLVGPRPEDRIFVELQPRGARADPARQARHDRVVQLAFAKEAEILDPSDRVEHYLERILPQKIGIDTLYAARGQRVRTCAFSAGRLSSVFLRRDVAVNRATGELGVRRRPPPAIAPVPAEQTSP